MLNNIPIGFDENGVYRGDGRWSDDEEELNINLDDFEPVAIDDYVECGNCGEIIRRDQATTTFYKTGYLCPICADDPKFT
jgi:formylmethanofuran dehydrogenase subunit E